MNEFPDVPLPVGLDEGPANNIDNDISHLGSDVISADQAQPAAPMRPQLSPEEENDRRELMLLAKRIRTSKNGKIKLDQDILMKLDPSNLQFLSNDEIEEVVSDAKFEIATHHSASATNMMFMGGAVIVEKALVRFTPVKANGFASVVNPARNAEIEMLLEEMSFDMRPKFVPPHLRLAYAVANALYAVHTVNEAAEEKIAEQMKKEAASKEAQEALDRL